MVQLRGIVLDRPDDGPDPGRQQQRQPEHHRRVAQREEESDGKGALPVAHQLAGGVVDGGDVVGVEGVPQAQGVGRQPDTNAKRLAAQAKPCRLHDVYQGDPAEKV